jgi:class 3 adenylate cyclase/tetratricopeptide (TPR) repeat protein
LTQPHPEPIAEQIAKLQAALAAQESLRPTLGDAIVEVAVAAIQARLDALSLETRAAPAPSAAPARLAEFTPEELLRFLQACEPGEMAGKIQAVGRIDGERKQVSVLSVDISGLAALWKAAAAEDAVSALNSALKEIAEAVYRSEGIIDKISGDSILAVFGAPMAHEDDPERALRAALEIRHGLDRFFDRWTDRTDPLPPFRIGVNSGPVVSGKGGSTAYPAYTLMGETVNTASRLENAARPGQILVGQEIFRVTQATFEYLALDPILIKGKREPQLVFELQQARLLPGKTRGVKELAPAFVGREAELAELRAAIKDMQAGRGRVILISGEAGLGKSRLLAELRAEAPAQDGAGWIEGHAFAHTTSLTYAPFIDLLRRLYNLSDAEADPLARLQILVERIWPGEDAALAVVAQMLAIPTQPHAGDTFAPDSADAMRANLLALFEAAIVRLAHQGPVWMVIEDLHWIDLTSLELIEQLIPLTCRLPFTIVATSRPISISGEILPRFQAMTHLHCADRFMHLGLSRLSEGSSSQMVEQLLSTPVLPAGLRNLILNHADGNPFFIEEILRALIDGGALVFTGGEAMRWMTTPLIESYLVPDSLHGLLMARLDRLPSETKWLAQQAAVIGRIFNARILNDLAGDAVEVIPELNALERVGLIHRNGPSTDVEYTFNHALTQEVVYASLLAPRRREAHSRVGMALEAHSGAVSNENISIIGEHFLHGEVWDKAYDYLLRAGDSAARLYAPAEARLHYEGALEALTHLPENEATLRLQVALLIKLDNVSYLVAESGRREAHLSAAEDILQRLVESSAPSVEDRRLLCQIYLAMARHFMLRSAHSTAFRYNQQALDIAREIGDGELSAILMSSLGIIAALQGQFLQSTPLLQQSLAPLAKIGSWEYWISAAVHLNLSLAVQGKFRDAAEIAEQVHRRASELKSLTGITQADCAFLIIPILRRDFRPALAVADRALQSAEQSKDIVLTSMVLRFKAWAQSCLGEHAAAAENLANAHQINAGVGSEPFPVWHAALDAEIELNAGRVEESLRLAERAVDSAQTLGNDYGAGIAYRVWAQALTHLNPPDWEAVERRLEASLAAFERSGGVVEAARTRSARAQVCQARGNRAEARRWGAEALAEFKRLGLDGEAKQADSLASDA